MTSKLLIQKIYLRLTRMKWVILLFALFCAIAGYVYAKSRPVIYTAEAKVFPNTGGGESGSSGAGAQLSQLLGGGSSAKSLSDEATISLEEVANSRKTREATVAERLPQFGNKMIAELFIDDYNSTKAFYVAPIQVPAFDSMTVSVGAALLRDAYVAKVNKNSLLEIKLSAADERLLSPVSYILIDKISVFYRELRRRKAKEDYDFTQGKVDSLRGVMNSYDRRMVAINKTSLFTPQNRLQYTLPKENLMNDKMRVLSQLTSAAANREDALWRLQKVTPVVDILDRPQPPFRATRASGALFGTVGFILGLMLVIFALIAPFLYRYLTDNIHTAVFPPNETVTVTTTA